MRAVVLDLKGMEGLDLSPIESEVSELVTYDLTPASKVTSRIAGFDIVITNKTSLQKKSIESSSSLKLIAVLATGANMIDVTAASERGVPVSNCVAYGVDSVVQHVWSLILALHTNLVSYAGDVRKGEWEKSAQFCFFNHPISELKGKTLGIIGYGNLGKGVAQVAEAFGMNVIVANRVGVPLVQGRLPLAELLKTADVISIHCPLNQDTSNLISEKELSLMKPTAFLINAARGGIVNESDLALALKQGVIAGAGIDVLSQEPPRNGNVLLDPTIPNLVITPHIAWGSEEARNRIIAQTAENIAAFKQGAALRTVR